MNCRTFFSEPVGIGLAIFAGVALHAEPVPTGSPADAVATKTLSLQPPAPASPVDAFRRLLVMTQAERREFIAKRPPEAQKVIQEKIREYEGLPREQRDLRLYVTELRWYLQPLMSTPATNRASRLSMIPNAELREQIEARLREWDKLEPRVQRDLLENEATVRFYFELAARPTTQRTVIVTNALNVQNHELESGIERWQALTEEQRQEIALHFYQFFDLTSSEKTKVLTTLSKPERQQIQKTLDTFQGLGAAQRAECMRSFERFASFSPDERREFLKNAEKWERMTPSERQTWRNLVSNLAKQPPLPGNLGGTPPPAPPSHSLRSAAAPDSLLTNTN